MSNSDIQKINTNEVMSAVTVFNKVVYLSGQVPKIPSKMWQAKPVKFLQQLMNFWH